MKTKKNIVYKVYILVHELDTGIRARIVGTWYPASLASGRVQHDIYHVNGVQLS